MEKSESMTLLKLHHRKKEFDLRIRTSTLLLHLRNFKNTTSWILRGDLGSIAGREERSLRRT